MVLSFNITKMMWPSSQASKILFILLLFIIAYCIYMDFLMFIRVRCFKLDIFDALNNNDTETSTLKAQENYGDTLWVSCNLNPLCHPTVKALVIDPINHYIYGPLCSLLDRALGISQKMLFLTPNMISFFHVFVALTGAKLLTCKTLAMRRLAVVLFQLRMFLDDLDGHVARERKNIKGERSEVGTLGYWVDGICDLIGVVFMIIGILFYFKNNPPRRGYKGTTVNTLPYHPLKEINSVEDIEKEHTTEIGITYKTKTSFRKVVQVVGLFSGQMVLSSLAWNRYIDIYQELLENCTEFDLVRRESAFKSSMFFIATWLWRVVNPHSYLHLLSLAIFCDKTWVFLKAVHHSGFLVLVAAVAVSEYILSCIRLYVVSGKDWL